MLTRVFIITLLGVTLTTTSITVILAQDLESGVANGPIKIQRINSPVELDGLSNEAAWNGIKSLPMLMRIPNFGSEPSERKLDILNIL